MLEEEWGPRGCSTVRAREGRGEAGKGWGQVVQGLARPVEERKLYYESTGDLWKRSRTQGPDILIQVLKRFLWFHA